MTPEELLLEWKLEFCVATGSTGANEMRPIDQRAIVAELMERSRRAALRERDARLLKLAAEWDEHAESVWNEEPHTAQDFTRCAKDLRALLEEAGKP